MLTNVRKLTTHRLLFSPFPHFTHSKNHWNQVTFLFTRSRSCGNGCYSSMIELFVNGQLGHTSRLSRYPAGVRTLYVGASPSHEYHLEGRIYQLFVSSSVLNEDQVESLMTNHAEEVKAIAQLCEGTYLLRSEPAPIVSIVTQPPMLWSLAVEKGAAKSVEQSEVKESKESKESNESNESNESKQSKESTRSSDSQRNKAVKTSTHAETRHAESPKTREREIPVKKVAKPMLPLDGQPAESVRSHAAPTENPAQTQDTVAEADLRENEESEAQAQLNEVAQCSIVGSPLFHHLQTPPSELLQRYIDREAFRPHKKVPGSLRGGGDALIRPPPAEKDEYCALSPPTPLPVLSGDLERFVSLLLEKDGQEIRDGVFQFAVPESLHDEYHYLTEYRAKYIREAFCFAWAG